MNSRIVRALAISAGLALVITGIFYYVALRDAGVRDVPMSEVVIAVKDLEVGSEIQPGDLRVEPWPSAQLPEGAHQVSSWSSVVFRSAASLRRNPFSTDAWPRLARAWGLPPKFRTECGRCRFASTT